MRLGTPTTASTTINDSDSAVTVVAKALDPLTAVGEEAVTVDEGQAQLFEVELSGEVSEDVIVAFATMDGTATAGADYTAPEEGATLVIAAGETAGTITVDTFEDDFEEANETFELTLTLSDPPANVRLRVATATASIRDKNELTARLVGPLNVAEGKSAVFTVKLDGGTGSEAVILDYTVNNEVDNESAAAEGDDYKAPSGTLTIPRGTAAGNIVIPTIADDELELDETLIVKLSEPTSASTAGTVGLVQDASSHTMTIMPSDTVILSVNDVTVIEGDPAVFTVTMSAAVTEAVTVLFSTMDTDAIAGEDYTAAENASLVIVVGQTMATLTVDTLEDTTAENPETFTVTLTLDRAPNNVAYGTRMGTATITDDTLSASVEGPETVTEGHTADFTVTLTGAVGEEPVVVTYTVTGEATSGEDYTPPSETLTIPAGATTGTIMIATRADGVLEGDETLVLILLDATTTTGVVAVASPATAETTIKDSDGMVTVSLTDAETVVEDDPATFTVTLSARVAGQRDAGLHNDGRHSDGRRRLYGCRGRRDRSRDGR